jgi:hypothetical protein
MRPGAGILPFTCPERSLTASIGHDLDRVIDGLIASLPDPERLTTDQRRGIIARYTAVLEGNFIYWMTAAYLSVSSDAAHTIIADNLREEVRDGHPDMLRRFAMAARALPTEADVLAVHRPLQRVRTFVGRLVEMNLVVMMAFFEGFITRFMPYLAELAARQGSSEREYTDVHGVVDIEHTEGLFRALEAELAMRFSLPASRDLMDGVEVLRVLIDGIVFARAGEPLGVAA